MMLYLWQQQQWQQIQDQIGSGRLAHALLLIGSQGLGKRDFAEQLAASLLCKQTDSTDNHRACGHCDACLLIEAGTHPDLLRLEPEEPGRAIKVDDVRALSQSLAMTSQYEGYKIAIIDPADQLNINAANSLLKTLEEPTGNTLLILVSAAPDRLPVTIRSRCQKINFQQPELEHARQWLEQQNIQGDGELLLKLAHGSPLLAKTLVDQELIEQRTGLLDALIGVAGHKPITGFSPLLAKSSQPYLLGWMYDWISDLLKLHQTPEQANLVNIDRLPDLKRLLPSTRIETLFALLDDIIKLRQLQSIPLNTQLLWEDLLITWGRALKSS